MKTLKQKGFTLIELLVVVAIIGVLASVVLSNLSAARSRAIAVKTVSQFRKIEDSLFLALLDENRNTYWNENSLGGNNISFENILAISEPNDGSSISDYLSLGDVTLYRGGIPQYDNEGDVSADCDAAISTAFGVNIIGPIDQFTVEELRAIDRIVDGDNSSNCGKFAYGFSNFWFYQVSFTQEPR